MSSSYVKMRMIQVQMQMQMHVSDHVQKTASG